MVIFEQKRMGEFRTFGQERRKKQDALRKSPIIECLGVERRREHPHLERVDIWNFFFWMHRFSSISGVYFFQFCGQERRKRT